LKVININSIGSVGLTLTATLSFWTVFDRLYLCLWDFYAFCPQPAPRPAVHAVLTSFSCCRLLQRE